MRTWRHVSPSEPCRICNKPDWCTVSADGAWAICRRVDTGAGLHRVDKAGGEFWLYRPDGRSMSRHTTIELPSQPCIERADSVTLDRVHRALLAALPLSSTHRQALRQRGLSDTEIVRRLYRTLPREGRAALAKGLVDRFGGDICAQIPGFYWAEHAGRRWWTLAGAPGLLIPVRTVDGRIVAVTIRADDAAHGHKYTWFSSAKHNGPGPAALAHVPLYTGPQPDTLRVTEGPLKGDIATALSGVLTVSIPGVAMWRKALPILQALQAQWVYLAFDSDWRQNPHVARSLAQATQALVEAGYTVRMETWDPSCGKGIDDVLAAGYTPDLQSTVPWLHRARTLSETSGKGPSHIVVEVR